jgi:uncharacterized cupin superfamily protein
MASYEKAGLDEIAAAKWPHWIPVRHHFGIETFGVNAYRRDAGEGAVPEHDERESGEPELYYVASGHAVFAIGGEEVDAPAGTFVWVSDPEARRSAEARDDGTVILAVGAGVPGRAYSPGGWDSRYLEGDD